MNWSVSVQSRPGHSRPATAVMDGHVSVSGTAVRTATAVGALPSSVYGNVLGFYGAFQSVVTSRPQRSAPWLTDRCRYPRPRYILTLVFGFH